MHAIIIHGMGRTPLSMCFLALRLRSAGFKISFFAYIVTFESWYGCTSRLARLIERRTKGEGYIVVAHSLGAVLARAVIAEAEQKPEACFFLASPTQASQAARQLASRIWYRLLSGEMGQLLADQAFMSALPIPNVPIFIYSGDAGFTGKFSPFKNEPNDGVLMVKETHLPDAKVKCVPSLHTFIMNNRVITNDIIEKGKNTSVKS